MTEEMRLMRETINQQYAEIVKLNRNIDALNLQIRKKDKEIEKLLERLSKYENPDKNSNNSSTPPSKERMKDEIVRRTRTLRKPSGKKAGGQNGHEGHKLSCSSTPDVVIDDIPSYCTHCGESLADAERVLDYVTQVVSIPELKPVIKEIRHYVMVCRNCGERVRTAPRRRSNDVVYDASVKSLAVYLSVVQFLPYGRIASFMSDGDRYNLQYRTAGDKKVRPEHAALDRVTLPITDTFWEEYYPPNGWNCRCTVVQVLKSKYPVTPHDEAMALGEEATGKEAKGIFKFNAGKEQKAVPDYNPYTIRRCNDCDLAKGKTNLVFIPDNELCAACRLIRAQKNENTGAAERILRYDETRWERTYVSPKDIGLVATQLERIAEATASNAERNKFNKEMRMCKVLADNGHDVEYLQGVNRSAGQTYDILFDSIKADLKCVTGGAGNIVKYAKKALTKQGGEAVVFEIPSHNPKYYEALAEARRKCTGRIFFYFMDDMELKEIK